jgi:glycosyltransferase involved in cell wall biosynthesis
VSPNPRVISTPLLGAPPPAPRVLYATYWGALEPLGQALVLPALERMAAQGVALSLLSFEKAGDLRSRSLVEATEERLRACGTSWVALRYHKRPRLPATIFDVVNGWRTGVWLGRRRKVQVVHGRTFVGGLIGRAVATTLGVPFVYHNEGFYPDEMVDGGFWAQDSPMHRVTRALERSLYEGADGLIVLSSRAARRVESLPSVSQKRTPVIVVPSCVDLQRFVPGTASSRTGPLRLVYSGAVGGRYELDRVGRFVAVLAERAPVRLAVLTRESRAIVAQMLAAGGLQEPLWESCFVPHTEMPARLASEDAGLFFLARGISELGCSPTKIGEYWACGLPIITTPGVSDTDEIIARLRCGVIVPEPTDEAYRRAGADLQVLLADPDLHVRCRAAAKAHYALEPACDRQVQLYTEVSVRQA